MKLLDRLPEQLMIDRWGWRLIFIRLDFCGTANFWFAVGRRPGGIRTQIPVGNLSIYRRVGR